MEDESREPQEAEAECAFYEQTRQLVEEGFTPTQAAFEMGVDYDG